MAKAFFVLMYLFVALFVLAMVPYEGGMGWQMLQAPVVWVIHDIGFGAWSTEIGVIVGAAMHKAALQATTGRGRKG